MPCGRLHVFGGDFDNITLPTLPALVPPFFLVAKCRVQPDEVGKEHKFKLVLEAPGEEPKVVGGVDLNTIRNPHDPTRPSGATVVIQIGMGFEEAGEHIFRIVVNDIELGSVSLLVTLAKADT